MERAEELLHDPQLDLEAIAEQVGFANAANLSRAMKAHFGLTPRQIRKRAADPSSPGSSRPEGLQGMSME